MARILILKCLLCLFFPLFGYAETNAGLFVVSVSSTQSFDPHLGKLRYADLDAKKFANAMVDVGMVPKNSVKIIPTASIGNFRKFVDKFLRGQRTGGQLRKFVFFFSGHSDDRGLHLRDGVISKTELHQFIAAVDATTKIAFLDGCFSGALSTKGIKRGEAFALPQIEVDEPSGTVFLASSSSSAYSFENDAMGGSVFSHFLVDGLYGEGDADQDGIVTIDELYRFVYSRTRFETVGYPVEKMQVPEFVNELQGRGALVLSYPGQTTVPVTIAENISGEISILPETGMQELRMHKRSKSRTTVQLVPGSYRFSFREKGRVAEKKILIAANEPFFVERTGFAMRAPMIGSVKGRVRADALFSPNLTIDLGAGRHSGIDVRDQPGVVFEGALTSTPLQLGAFKFGAHGLASRHEHISDSYPEVTNTLNSYFVGFSGLVQWGKRFPQTLQITPMFGRTQWKTALTEVGESVDDGDSQVVWVPSRAIAASYRLFILESWGIFANARREELSVRIDGEEKRMLGTSVLVGSSFRL